MSFNATYKLETLANNLGLSMSDFLIGFHKDLSSMVDGCDVAKLGISSNGNRFSLQNSLGQEYVTPTEAGLYCIFSCTTVIYVGESTTSLMQRIVKDVDDTANSKGEIYGKGRPVLKYLMNNQLGPQIGIVSLAIQIYPASFQLPSTGQNFGDKYDFSNNSIALEGLARITIGQFRNKIVSRAIAAGVI